MAPEFSELGEGFLKMLFSVKNPDLIKSSQDCHLAKQCIVKMVCIKYLTSKTVFKI